MGGNIYTGAGLPSHIQVSRGFTEDMKFRPTVTVDGVVQDLPSIANRSRLDVFGEFYAPLVDIAGVTLTKSSSWITRNIINPVKSIFSSNKSTAEAVTESATQGGRASTLEPGPYAGDGVPASKGKSRSFTADERAQINQQGQENGCHTCGTKSAGTKSGNFIPDHQPPNSLVPDGTPQTLYPHCKSCSASQGGTLGAMKRAENIKVKPGDAGPAR